jgi:hypothetical protein
MLVWRVIRAIDGKVPEYEHSRRLRVTFLCM